jgi:hypothetical protein
VLIAGGPGGTALALPLPTALNFNLNWGVISATKNQACPSANNGTITPSAVKFPPGGTVNISC